MIFLTFRNDFFFWGERRCFCREVRGAFVCVLFCVFFVLGAGGYQDVAAGAAEGHW